MKLKFITYESRGTNMLDSKYQRFYDEIVKKIKKEKIFTDKLHTLAYGTDASFYRLIPKIVIKTDVTIIFMEMHFILNPKNTSSQIYSQFLINLLELLNKSHFFFCQK